MVKTVALLGATRMLGRPVLLCSAGEDRQESRRAWPDAVTYRMPDDAVTKARVDRAAEWLKNHRVIVSPQNTGRSLCVVAWKDPTLQPDDPELSLVSGGATVVGDGVLATVPGAAHVVFCQLTPWQCDYSNEKHNVKQTFRRSSFLVTRLLGNLGVELATPLLARFNQPVNVEKAEKRWLDGLYLDEPEEWDDPYRFFRW